MVPGKVESNEAMHHDSSHYSVVLHKILDDLNIKIAKELVNDPYISSTEIAAKFGVPLSTIQRRRARLEASMLKKEYTFDVRKFGWRVADLLISVEKGKAEETALKLLRASKSNVITASLRIGHPQIDIMASVFYKNSQELHKLTETIKAMPYVTSVEWAEIVKGVGSNAGSVLDKLLDGSAR